MVEENGLGILLYKVKGSQSINPDTYEGMEVALHTTAMGKPSSVNLLREAGSDLCGTRPRLGYEKRSHRP